MSQPGEEGLVARLCGLQIVLVAKNYSVFKQSGCRIEGS